MKHEKMKEQRVQNFLDSEVLRGDKEKVLYLKLYNKLKSLKQQQQFTDVLAFRFYERDVREELDSLGHGNLGDFIEQKQLLNEFFEMVVTNDNWLDYFDSSLNRMKVEVMLEDEQTLFSTARQGGIC